MFKTGIFVCKMLQYSNLITISFFLLVVFNGCSFDSKDSKECGIVLGFDDYYPTWEQHFDLFDKYGAKVTFFVTGDTVTDFMFDAQNRGHEIGYHTISHPHLPKLSKEHFFEETIASIIIFRDAGIELTSFAFPYGDFELWMIDELLQHYQIVRKYDGSKFLYTKDEIKYGIIDSKTIDNIAYKSIGSINLRYQYLQDIYFRYSTNKRLKSARKQGKIITLTSHCISDRDWGTTPKRLEYVLQKGKKYNLSFYTYKDLQKVYTNEY